MRVAALLFTALLVGCGDDDDAPADTDAGADLGVAGDAGSDAGPRDATVSDDAVVRDGGADAGPRATLDDVLTQVCGAIARIRCTAAWDCACVGFGGRPDGDECRANETADCRATFGESARGVAIAAGTLDTDRAALGECLAAVEASYSRCSGSVVDLEERCGRAFVSVDSAIGDACAAGLCADGAGICTAGECAALPAERMSCIANQCAPGLRCVVGECARPGADAALCETDADCADSLACNAGRCNALGGVGAVCATRAQCGRGLVCVSGACAAPLTRATCSDTDASACGGLETCGAPRVDGRCRATVALGAVCEDSSACTLGRCDTGMCAPRSSAGTPCGDPRDCGAGLVCSFDGDCRPAGTSGAACVAGFGTDGCAAGLACVSSTCRPLPASGRPCSDTGECADGLVCRVEPAGVVCGPPRAVGDACAGGNAECGPMGRCDSGTCAARLGDGDTCTFDEDCRSPLRCGADPMTFATTCQAPRTVSEECGGICETGTYCRSEPAASQCETAVCNELTLLPRPEK